MVAYTSQLQIMDLRAVLSIAIEIQRFPHAPTQTKTPRVRKCHLGSLLLFRTIDLMWKWRADGVLGAVHWTLLLKDEGCSYYQRSFCFHLWYCHSKLFGTWRVFHVQVQHSFGYLQAAYLSLRLWESTVWFTTCAYLYNLLDYSTAGFFFSSWAWAVIMAFNLWSGCVSFYEHFILAKRGLSDRMPMNT